MNWFLQCSPKTMPDFNLGWLSAGGTNWGYAMAGAGEPLVYPPPSAGNGTLIQSSAHNSWYLGKGGISNDWAMWHFASFPVIFNNDMTISQGVSPNMMLCLPNLVTDTFLYWLTPQDSRFENSVLVFTWQQK